MTRQEADGAGRDVDPRIARTRKLVREAVLAELADVGMSGLTVESVAERSGVAKSTLYRHWSGRLDLVADALRTSDEEPAAETAWSTARSGAVALLGHLAVAMADPATSPQVAALVEAAERDPAVAEAFHAENRRRRGVLAKVIGDGVSTGELPATVDPELAAAALAGAIFYRRFLAGTPLTPDTIEDLVTTVLGPPAP